MSVSTPDPTGEALRLSEARYRRLFETAQDGILILDADTGRVEDANPFMHTLLGYPPGEIVGFKLWEIGPFKHIEASKIVFAELKTRDCVRYESLSLERRDGGRVEAEFISNVYVAAGRAFIQCNIRDLSARKRSEEMLRLLSSAMHQSKESIIIMDARLDPSGPKILFVNPAFTLMTGYTADELIGQTPKILHGPDTDHAVLDRLCDCLAQGEIFQGETTNYRKNGEAFQLEWQITPIRDPEGIITHFGSILRDVTAMRFAESELRASEERFRQVVENIREVFWIRDVAKDRITYVSPGYNEIWGEAPDALYATPEHFATTIQPADRARIAQAAREKQAVGSYNEVFRIVRPDGGLRWIRSKGFPVRDDAGTVYRIAGVSEDITEQKQHEEQSLRNQRLESVGLLAAGITHDLNNVLAPISMVVTLLRPQLSRPMDLRLLDTLEKCATRGAGLVRQILGFVHGVKGEQRIVQVAHLLHDIANVVAETFPKSIQLDEQVPSDLWPVQANPTQIHQVLINLCVNARDAMPKGGTLRLRAKNCSFDHADARAIEGAAPGDWLMLEISDTGTGIPPELLSQIWDPFFTTKTADAGTGLGLSTVRGIVETCHGFITLRTEAGRGTTICIYLPAAMEEVEDDGTASPLPCAPGHGELILLVDDEESIRDLVGTTLTQAGYKVITAVDGFAAMVSFEERSAEIALVITDLDMPNVNGDSLRHIIHTFRPSLKILTMSGNGQSRPVTAAEPGLAPSAHLAKPFTVEMLLTHVQRLLHGSGSRSPLPVSDDQATPTLSPQIPSSLR